MIPFLFGSAVIVSGLHFADVFIQNRTTNDLTRLYEMLEDAKDRFNEASSETRMLRYNEKCIHKRFIDELCGIIERQEAYKHRIPLIRVFDAHPPAKPHVEYVLHQLRYFDDGMEYDSFNYKY